MEPFIAYSLEIVGLGFITVLDPEGVDGYRIRLPDNQVTAFAAVSGEPCEANAAADIAHAIANPPPIVVSPESLYATALAAGYFDTATGIKLKTTESAQSKFTSQVTLIQVAIAAGALTPASVVSFWDFADEEQQLTVANFLGLILRYGLHCQGLFAALAP